MENNEKITAVPVSMAAIDPYVQVNIISPTEKKAASPIHTFMFWFPFVL